MDFEDINIYIIRSRRKTISVEIRPDLSLLVRAPARVSKKEIAAFLSESSGWIEKHLKKAREKKESEVAAEHLSREEIRQLAYDASRDIPERVRKYAAVMNVTYGRITIRNQKSRWGSCSSKKNLNFNCLLMLAPERHRDYVVVHELCHLKEMNHSARFWKEVENVLPDYRDSIRWFRENGEQLMARMQAF